MNKWLLVNQYRRLADIGLVNWPACDCGTDYITVIGKDDDPVLWCPTDDIYLTPGVWVYDQMQAAVMEYNN